MELLLKRPLAILDLETTGTNVAKDRIVEIAAIKIMPDGNIHEKETRVNPMMPIPAAVTAIHHISNEDVKDAPTFDQIAKTFFIFLDDCDLAGFNSLRFDLPILLEEFHRAGVIFDLSNRKLIDVQRIYHIMEPRTLSAAYKFYCRKSLDDAHNAMEDVKATFEVLKSQLDRYPAALKNDMDFLHELSKDGDFVDLGKRMYFDNGTEMFNFGKHKGKAVVEVFKFEPSYYDWIMKSEFPMDFKEKIRVIRDRMKIKLS
ncbi:MAG TPA: 3'-5' exonuclease [Chitinophagales bacterium]|nr:3'-5' exonuclease [Chitinophagales bacterium]